MTICIFYHFQHPQVSHGVEEYTGDGSISKNPPAHPVCVAVVILTLLLMCGIGLLIGFLGISEYAFTYVQGPNSQKLI